MSTRLSINITNRHARLLRATAVQQGVSVTEIIHQCIEAALCSFNRAPVEHDHEFEEVCVICGIRSYEYFTGGRDE